MLKYAEGVANSKIETGRKRMKQEKFVCAKEIISGAVDEYRAQREKERLAQEKAAQEKAIAQAQATKETASTPEAKTSARRKGRRARASTGSNHSSTSTRRRAGAVATPARGGKKSK